MSSDAGDWEHIQDRNESRGSGLQHSEVTSSTISRHEIEMMDSDSSPIVQSTEATQGSANQNASEHNDLPHNEGPLVPITDELVFDLPVRPAPPETSLSHLTASDGAHRWPPHPFTPDSALTLDEAEALVCSGASIFKGYCDDIPNAPNGHYRFYATVSCDRDQDMDRAGFQHRSFKMMSLPFTGPADFPLPWESLEQPSMAFCFGMSPGTITLNYWTSVSGSLEPVVKVGTKVKPKKIGLLEILDRLRDLELGLEERDTDSMYRTLYNKLIHDPGKHSGPHLLMEDQIADLITVLSHQDWIDFSLTKNHVVAKYFRTEDQTKHRHFFLQLLLSVELYLRIHSEGYSSQAKYEILARLPPKIAFDLAVAQRWLENMAIEKPKTSSKRSSINFELKKKRTQIKALREFARILKWPNMGEVDYILDERDQKETAVEDRSADTMSWFTGVFLPGVAVPWLVMNSLIDCDRDTDTRLNYLTHMHPSSGFQYRANTYWSWECIVGKVLGAFRGVNQVAGWIGPCYYSTDLKRIEVARVHVRRSKQRLSPKDVTSMARRSEPLGPPGDEYLASDYQLVSPDTEDVTDAIRVEKLNFEPRRDQRSRIGETGSLIFNAGVTFAIEGRSWPLRLRYDVHFITASPCNMGPHPLYWKFRYRACKVDDLKDVHDWGKYNTTSSTNSSEVDDGCTHQSLATYNNESEDVLMIEAFGVSDNEVFARAWCSHWGVGAITADLRKTCASCAIREAYAACLTVVILTNGGREEEVES
ncbi:MAG: hypothetical protein M1819_001607 [Sarea resinae]|nr:MAG: hypothetical protein M1819_001607 [Sarea resinae]